MDPTHPDQPAQPTQPVPPVVPQPEIPVVQPQPTPPPVQTPPPQEPFPPAVEAHDAPHRSFPIKKVLIGVCILLVLGLISTGAYVMGARQSKPKPAAMVAPPTAPTPYPTVDPTESWQVYTNTTHGYKVSYPNNWFIYPDKLGGRVEQYKATLLSSVDLSSQLDNPRGLDIPNTESTLTISLVAIDKLESESIDDYLTRNAISPLPSQKVIIGDGIVGRMGSSDIATVIYFSSMNKIYSFSYRNIPEEKKDTINKIISTFQFTEQPISIDTSTWKTYTNDKIGYSVQYPGEWSVVPKSTSGTRVDSVEGMYPIITFVKSLNINTSVSTSITVATPTIYFDVKPGKESDINMNEKQYAMVDGVKAIKEIDTTSDEVRYIFYNKNFIYTLHTKTENADTLTNMISTFKLPQ